MTDTTTINQIATAFEEFKSANDQRLVEIEKKGSADVVLTNKVDAINDTLTELQKKMSRPSISDNDEVAVEHRAAFDKWARKGDRFAHELEEMEKKAITVGLNADGTSTAGSALPRQIEAGVYESLLTISPIRAEATVISVSSPDYRILVDQRGFGAGWVGETDPRPQTATPTLGELRVPFGEVYANPFVSQQALDDYAFDVDSFIVNSGTVKFAQMENAAFVAGSGVNQPQGILTTPGITTLKTGVDGGFAATNASDIVIQMIGALPAAYRQGAKFLSASSTLTSIRTMKNAQGSYIWQPSLIAGQPSTLAGYDIVEAEEMPGVGTAGNLPLAFGNIKEGYLIADRVGIRVLRDPYSNKPFVGFYMTKRVGGMVKDKSAFVLLSASKN